MTGNQQTELLSPPREVDVIAIERELTQLWKDATDESGESSSRPVTRACALNFIVITEDARELEALGDLAGDVTLEHPARIFLIAANRRSGTPDLDAWISARCSLPVPGGRQVCCEQINLLASGAEANKIPSIVTSLLVPDVPGVLLWKARVNVRDHILQSLAHVVDRILIDTSEDPSPESGLLAWREFMRNRSLHVMYGDLAWTHLTAWRSVVAGSFNPPDMRARLSQVSSVTVTYSSTSAPQHSGLSQSLLFVAWLASKVVTVQSSDSGSRRSTFRSFLLPREQIIRVQSRKLPLALAAIERFRSSLPNTGIASGSQQRILTRVPTTCSQH